jgi:hypothetical protein
MPKPKPLEPTEIALQIIDKLKAEGLYKGFTLFDIRDVSQLVKPKISAKKFLERWKSQGIRAENIGWHWFGLLREDPSLMVSYKGRINDKTALKICNYMFEGKEQQK